ncbi:DUF3558 domain-containing protein [Nocardia asteroides]|uniref:DUF3558 domain-containing protein n=1 Tax=Nocardia asteroides TaxID=1824 RepID=UPI001E479A6F|nr:DUF3558 domain-containing protein [Nocardia asteroides]UGT53126.1 DUF3558 domain-containing protein [Nocardia asteroides]
MRLIGLAVGACAVLVLAGCSEEVGGQAEVSGAPLTKEQLFDPCTVPDGALTAAGLDPASKDDNLFSVPRAEWKGCGWTADGHFISFMSTVYTMDEIRANDRYHDFKEVTVGDRKALQFYIGTEQTPVECELAIETGQGRALINASKFVDSKSPTDPCSLANNAAPHFIAYVPR